MAGEIPGGYNGKILRVDLTNNSTSVEALSDDLCRKYLGGAGFTTYLLWKELKPGIDPLGPENKLIFANGPLTGLAFPGTGRNCVGAKSPLTGGIAKAESGGFWGSELKRAGYDVIIVEGKAEHPVYIWIQDGVVEIKDARHLWGKTTKETQEAVRSELNDARVQLASIGPAGENLVLFSCIMNGLIDAAGRGGLGAVMGSKNLKAIALRGHKLPAVANPDKVKEFREWMLANMALTKDFQDFGTGSAMIGFEQIGNLPVRNFRDGLFPAVKDIDARTLRDTIRVKMEGCYGCPVRCKKVVEIKEPYQVDPAYGGPEYETLASLGSNCGVDNLAAISMGNQLCAAYSVDTISMGAVISFAMECYENGLIDSKDTGGIDLKFGNEKAMLQMIEVVCRRQGIGDLLAEGVARAANRIGHGAHQYAMHVKGLEPGMHEPRAKPGLGLGFMVDPHGADHCMNLHDTAFAVPGQYRELRPLGLQQVVPVDYMGPEKVALFKAVQAKRTLVDSLVTCQFLPYSYQQLADITSAVTGWDTGVVEQLRITERILTVARLFNDREGFTAADDELPKRFYQGKTDGILANKPLDPEIMKQAKNYYYALMGWDKLTGIPLRERVLELGIA